MRQSSIIILHYILLILELSFADGEAGFLFGSCFAASGALELGRWDLIAIRLVSEGTAVFDP